jgi:DNA polymerase-3 subunit epsilon
LSALDRFVALDVEAASRTPPRICAIGISRYEFGRETAAYSSRVRVEGRIRFTDIHGLTASDLRNAPAWPEVWAKVAALLGNIQTVVAFRAAFDRAAILSVSARHGVRLARLRFVCAADLMERHFGITASLEESLRYLDVPFPGRPHDPLADARAAAAIVLRCSPPESTGRPS